MPILSVSMNREALSAALSVLGFESGIANPTEIKKRYRQLLFQYHPDVSNDKNSNKKVIEVIHAYRLLLQNYSNSNELFALIDSETEEIRLAIPIEAIIGFVSTQDTNIRSLFLFTVAQHQNQTYQIHSINGRNISASICQGWLLLLKPISTNRSSSNKSAFLFKELPKQIRFVNQKLKQNNQHHYILADKVEYLVPQILIQ
ncbi:MAG: J domain-containing protein [Leptonema sp. (in: Bacteria)]|nr:J domain-containing protein [Leptonema sp. (in: bacteria)]